MNKQRHKRQILLLSLFAIAWACPFWWLGWLWQPCPPPGRVWFPPPWIGHPGVPTDTNSGAPPVIIEWLN